MSDHISPWIPENNPHKVAVLGKLIEELSEASQRAARCLIQGAKEIDPETGATNAVHLAEELSDVYACLSLLDEFMGIHTDLGRVGDKIASYHRWHKLIDGDVTVLQSFIP